MKRELSKKYGQGSVTFYLTYEGDNVTILYRGIFSRFCSFKWIPVVGIAYNGTIVAVIDAYLSVGEVEEIVERALQEGKVLVRGPGGEVSYVISDGDRMALDEIFIENRLPPG